MQTEDKCGIVCDYCGTTHKEDFKYYSLDIRAADVFNNRRPGLDAILRSTVIFSLDICQVCMANIQKRIITNYNKLMSDKRRAMVPVTCEWTGAVMKGDYTYYYGTFAQVDVTMRGQPNVCLHCGHKTFDNDKQCSKCGRSDFTQIAAVEVNDRHLEFAMCDDAYNHFVDKAQTVRKIAGEWSTKVN